MSGDPETDPAKSGLDCFGLVRHALHHQFEGPLLESFCGIFRADKEGMTEGFSKSVGSFELCSPQAGAIACCFHKTTFNNNQGTDSGYVFHHIGICIDVANVMHTSSKHGYAVLPVRAFRRLASKVEFYKYIRNGEEG